MRITIERELAYGIWRDDFEAFLAWQQGAIWQEIDRMTGLSEATEVVPEDEAEIA